MAKPLAKQAAAPSTDIDRGNPALALVSCASALAAFILALSYWWLTYSPSPSWPLTSNAGFITFVVAALLYFFARRTSEVAGPTPAQLLTVFVVASIAIAITVLGLVRPAVLFDHPMTSSQSFSLLIMAIAAWVLAGDAVRTMAGPDGDRF